MEMKQRLPNATATLVLGILSIVLCFCYGLPGLICAVIAIAISGKSVKLYKAEPELYMDYGNIKAGRIMAIIGLCLSLIYFVIMIIWIAALGMDAFNMSRMLEQYQ